MFPSIVQRTFSWVVPAFVATLGIAAILAWKRHVSSRTGWNLAAGIFAVAHAVFTIPNLRIQGNAYGNIPFSSGATGYGPESVPVYFVAYSSLIGAVVCWALAALSASGSFSQLRKPLLWFTGSIVLVAMGYLLLETFG